MQLDCGWTTPSPLTVLTIYSPQEYWTGINGKYNCSTLDCIAIFPHGSKLVERIGCGIQSARLSTNLNLWLTDLFQAELIAFTKAAEWLLISLVTIQTLYSQCNRTTLNKLSERYKTAVVWVSRYRDIPDS